MAGESVGGWIYYEETGRRVYEGFKASSEKVKSINHRALGPEFHHFFKLQSFLPSVLEEEEGLKTDHDKDPEYEEAWTDTFYDVRSHCTLTVASLTLPPSKILADWRD